MYWQDMLSCVVVYGKCEAGDRAAHMEMITEIIKWMTLPRNREQSKVANRPGGYQGVPIYNSHIVNTKWG